MTAKIGLEDVRFHAPHGYFEEEHRMGNEFSIDVEVEAAIGGAAEDDDLGGTVNYATIYYLLQLEMKKPTLLLEALAYRMASRIVNQFDSVSTATLRLRKLNPPLGGKVGAAVVEVTVGAGGNAGNYAGGMGGQHTYEDSYTLPPPPPPPAAAPPMVFDDEGDDFDEEEYDDEGFEGDDFLSDEELAAMTAGGDLDLPDFDPDEFD